MNLSPILDLLIERLKLLVEEHINALLLFSETNENINNYDDQTITYPIHVSEIEKLSLKDLKRLENPLENKSLPI